MRAIEDPQDNNNNNNNKPPEPETKKGHFWLFTKATERGGVQVLVNPDHILAVSTVASNLVRIIFEDPTLNFTVYGTIEVIRELDPEKSEVVSPTSFPIQSVNMTVINEKNTPPGLETAPGQVGRLPKDKNK